MDGGVRQIYIKDTPKTTRKRNPKKKNPENHVLTKKGGGCGTEMCGMQGGMQGGMPGDVEGENGGGGEQSDGEVEGGGGRSRKWMWFEAIWERCYIHKQGRVKIRISHDKLKWKRKLTACSNRVQ